MSAVSASVKTEGAEMMVSDKRRQTGEGLMMLYMYSGNGENARCVPSQDDYNKGKMAGGSEVFT